MSFAWIFLIVSIVLFAVGSFGVTAGRINILAAGWFFFALAILLKVFGTP